MSKTKKEIQTKPVKPTPPSITVELKDQRPSAKKNKG